MFTDKRVAHPDEEDTVRHAIQWNKRWGQEYGGFYYQEALFGPEGMDVQIFVTEDTEDADIYVAELHARRTQDVVGFGALVVPKEWLDEPFEHRATVLETLRRTLREHTAQTLRWPGGETQLVDVTTANMLCQVVDALTDHSRKKFVALMETDRVHFLKAVDIGWGCVK